MAVTSVRIPPWLRAPVDPAEALASYSTLQIGMTAAGELSGTDRYFFSLLRELPPLGVGVSGIVLGNIAEVYDDASNVESFAPFGSGRLQRWIGVRKATRRLVKNVDLVVSHGTPHVFPTLDLLEDRPLVTHFHGPWALQARAEGLNEAIIRIRQFQEYAVFRRAKRFVVLSQAYADLLEREYHVSPERIEIIPGGVDLVRFGMQTSRDDARAALGWPSDRPIVIAARRIEASRGIENLVDAADLLRASVPDVMVAIAGSGSLDAAICRRIHERGLERTVVLTGYADEKKLPLMYRAADLSVVPTEQFEGFGLSVLEALACGTPTLVTPIGGLPEVVDELDPCLVLEGNGKAAIADGLARALTGALPLPDEAACRAHANRYDWRSVAERVKRVYNIALNT